MGVRNTATEGKVAMFDSTSGFAFGPTFDSESELDDFVAFVESIEPRDLRAVPGDELEAYVVQWRGARASVH